MKHCSMIRQGVRTERPRRTIAHYGQLAAELEYPLRGRPFRVLAEPPANG